MAQLDRFLNLLVTNNGSALVLSEGEVATVVIKDSPRPVMKQALTSAQIVTLVREIAPANQPHSLDAKGGVRFEYTSADGTFEVILDQAGKISARIQPKSASTNGVKANGHAPQAAAPAAPVSAATPRPAAPAPAPVEQPRAEPVVAAPRAAASGNRALDRIENLLRTLVGNKASDLHLRA